MRRLDRIFALLSLPSCLIWPLDSSAGYPISGAVFELLPADCKAWYASAQQLGKTEGYTIPDPERYRPNLLRKKLGSAATPMNHYCPALAALAKAEFPFLIEANAGEDQASLLRGAEEGIRYQIKYNFDHHAWNSSNQWQLAEAYTKLGDVDRLRGDPAKAVEQYQEAVKVLPSYVPAYIKMSQSYETLKLYDQGIAALEKAKRYRPGSGDLKEKIADLKAKLSKGEPNSK